MRGGWWRRSYSQFGEDVVVLGVLSNIDKGFYVDVGSFHPRRYSNTRALHESGWRGMNIDILPRKKALFGFDRPQDINICCAVNELDQEVTCYSFGHNSALDTIDKTQADTVAKRLESVR